MKTNTIMHAALCNAKPVQNPMAQQIEPVASINTEIVVDETKIVEEIVEAAESIKEFPKYKPTLVVLGTAHLSSTPGKRSPDGAFREYRYSREICQRVCMELNAMGISCVVDHIDDDMVGCNQSKELCNRVNIVNSYCNEHGTDNVIYVSIHVNAASCGEWKNATGWCIYTSKGVTKSDSLATSIYDEACNILLPMSKCIRKDFTDGDGDYEENFYVLVHSNCPAVLTENFFQDNKKDIEFLNSEEGKRAITKIHVNGIANWLKI